MKIRLDKLLVDNAHVPTREKAQFLIMTGQVLVNDQKITKSGQMVKTDSRIRLLSELPRYVSRGGDKMAGAFAAFGFPIEDRTALDVGISTGGFTDFLLQHGAKQVVGVDVGYGQVDLKIRRDPRVAMIERVNIRSLTRSQLHEAMITNQYATEWLDAIDLVVMDVSFISVLKVLPAVRNLVPAGDYIILVKPQFEAERDEVGKGGIIKDEALIDAIVQRVIDGVADLFSIQDRCLSPLKGTKGNQEVFLWLRPKN
ncbi:TlyA family RNA methyltransferase [bacterium]|nr:TlyA family RNA methyltransferase [bacterium]